MLTQLLLVAPLLGGPSGPQYDFPVHTAWGGTARPEDSELALVRIPAFPGSASDLQTLEHVWLVQPAIEAQLIAHAVATGGESWTLQDGRVSAQAYLYGFGNTGSVQVGYLGYWAIHQWPEPPGPLTLLPGEQYHGELQRIVDTCYDPWFDQEQQTMPPPDCWPDGSPTISRCFGERYALDLGGWQQGPEALLDEGDGRATLWIEWHWSIDQGTWLTQPGLRTNFEARTHIVGDTDPQAAYLRPIIGYQWSGQVTWYDCVTGELLLVENI